MVSLESAAEQDYLKYIYLLQQEAGKATTQMLAERLGVKPPSVTVMIKRLAEHPRGPCVRYTPYHGVALTERGTAIALEMLRHHRLLELFLAEQLDVPWDQVHEEAERLEHVLSEDLEDRIAAKLGQPTRDPHGDPIPQRDGRMDRADEIPLDTVDPGRTCLVSRVPDGDRSLLQYLGELGVVPGRSIEVVSVSSFRDVTTLRVGEEVRVLGGEIARHILVTDVSSGGPSSASETRMGQ